MFPKKVFARDGHLTDIGKRKLEKALKYFSNEDLSLTIPKKHRDGTDVDPYYHMVEGQSILVVCWLVHNPHLQLCCLKEKCDGRLERTRTNWSKNKTLFPIFRLDGPPMWAMVMNYQCCECNSEFSANDPRLMRSLPHWIRSMYPVEPQYTNPRSTWHLHKSVTRLFPQLMITYGNGELFSKMIYEGINTDYERPTAEYFSYHSCCRRTSLEAEQSQTDGEQLSVSQCIPYPTNPGEFLPRRCVVPRTSRTSRTSRSRRSSRSPFPLHSQSIC